VGSARSFQPPPNARISATVACTCRACIAAVNALAAGSGAHMYAVNTAFIT
jgi:hypothetical protein